MAFLDDLSSALLNQVGLSENTPSSLDTSQPGDFGKLGDFASKIDKSAQRSYVETGQIRNIRPRASEILMQEPDITVVIKKRMFSSLAENFKPELMDDDEKMFLRASKRLFENKCRAIAAYERLTKFERIVNKNDGMLSDQALPLLFNAVDSLNDIAANTGTNIFSGKTQSALESVRSVVKFSDPAFFTTWNINKEIPYATDTGDGTGTFDLTIVNSISCRNSVELGNGNCSLTIEDPYKLMIVSSEDIEQAISDATNLFKQRSFFKITEHQLKITIEDLKTRLRQVRRARGASDIFFKVSEETLLFKKIRAFIDEEGREIKFSFDAGTFGIDLFAFDSSAVSVDPGAFDGINGLSEDNNEADFFRQIIQNLFTLMSLHHTTRSENKEANKQTNYLRKKMQLHYGNKPIIQPMDVVYVFVGSKTLRDSKITQGLNTTFAGGNLVNRINQTIGNIESALDDIAQTFSGGLAGDSTAGDGSSLEIEKNLIAGPDFPVWLYSLMRNNFTRQAAGVCAFVGLVDSAPHSYSEGKYTLTVNCKDNSHYFKISQINVNPSVDVFNGALYDPLTPFKLDFDESSGLLQGQVPPLLDANVRLLNSKSVRGKLGRFRGAGLDEARYNLLEFEHITSGSGNSAKQSLSKRARRNFIDPDGFVYRWKEGIGSLVLFGEPHASYTTLGSFKSEASPNITKNPFAGQDVMNVLSLLITGQPYNYNNFVRGAIEFSKLQKDDLFNKDLSQSFFKGLISDVTKQNAIWGNFMPFKKLIVNERAYEFLASGEFDLTVKNAELNSKLRERAEKFDELTSVATQFSDTPQWYSALEGGVPGSVVNPSGVSILPSLQNEIIQLDSEINQLEVSFRDRLKTLPNLQDQNGTLGVFGDDISFDPTITGAGQDALDTEEARFKARRDLRKKINSYTRRRLWRVRANTDVNLFIVDDSYDKNYDIRAFEQALTSRLELFQSTYSGIFEQVDQVRKLIGLEVFADSQGNIQARPPQYNRMPSSVFRNMLQKKAEKGIQLFPTYLERLFFNSIQGLTDRIEIVEDQIRLRAAALGFNNDNAAQRLLQRSSTLPQGFDFKFLTSSEDGRFGGKDIRSLLRQDAPDLQEANAARALNELSAQLGGPLNATINFDAVKRSDVINDAMTFKGNDFASNNVIQNISNRLRRRLNQDVPSSVQAILSNDRVTSRAGRSQVDILRVVNQIARFVGERQRLIKTLSNAIKNLTEGIALNSSDNSSSRSILFPNIHDSDSEVLFPKLIEHMIEDENNDDLGPRAGRRYILSDDKIISMEIVEAAPEYNMVQVDGKLEAGLVGLPGGLDVNLTGVSGGNAIGTAWAVDYDLWRMYGFRGAQQFNAPFFSDPNTQCAPFAVYLLNLARKNIFRGTITLVGNEYIQAGEVYYIEDRDLLVYANSVNHSLTYNGRFVTTIDFTYGHNPGEYIPTHLDIIGKGLYSNRHQSELVRQVRHGNVDGSTPLTVVARDTSTSSSDIDAIIKGQFGEQNLKNLANMVLATTGLLTPTQFGKELNIELRIYKNSDSLVGILESTDMQNIAESVREWLIDPRKRSSDGQTSLTFSPETDDGGQGASIDASKVKLVLVDLNQNMSDETRSPSTEAWSLARSIVATSSPPVIDLISAQTPQDAVARQEVLTLVNQVLDVWITFTDPVQTTGTSKKQDNATSQAGQQEQNAANTAQSNK